MRSGQSKVLLTGILVVIWSSMCIYSIKLAWIVGWNKKSRLSNDKKTGKKGIIVFKQGGTTLSLLAKSFLLRNCPCCLALIEIVTPQLPIKARFLLMLITKPFEDKILFSTSMFTQRPSTKYSSHLIETYTCCLAWSSPRKKRKRAANWVDLCFEASIPLTFKKVDMILIFWWKRWLRSHVLLINITPQLVSR